MLRDGFVLIQQSGCLGDVTPRRNVKASSVYDIVLLMPLTVDICRTWSVTNHCTRTWKYIPLNFLIVLEIKGRRFVFVQPDGVYFLIILNWIFQWCYLDLHLFFWWQRLWSILSFTRSKFLRCYSEEWLKSSELNC